MKKQAFAQRYFPQQSDKDCALALLCLFLAIFFLSVVAFTFSPATPLGLAMVCVGVLCMFGCIFFFARYHHSLKLEEKQESQS
jgi:hypothetical protein